jgi:hypothetical protein
MRGLRVYGMDRDGDDLLDAAVHARSRFRSVEDPSRFAIYSVRDAVDSLADEPGTHTLVVVREFRRVPLHASALALMLFTARAGATAAVLGSLAHFVERAVSSFQPAYLLLAHSLEQPRISALVMGVHEAAALQAGTPTAFSLDALLPDLRPLLAVEPEWFGYCPESEREPMFHEISPYAV